MTLSRLGVLSKVLGKFAIILLKVVVDVSESSQIEN